MEQNKRRDHEFEQKAKSLEGVYEQFIKSLSTKVESVDFEEIKANF